MKPVYFIFLLFLLSSCHSGKKTSATRHVRLDTISVSARNNPMDLYRGSAPRVWDILHTRVALTFNYEEKTATGRAWIDIRPYSLDTGSIILDAKGMEIDTVALWKEGKLVPLPFSYSNDQLRIDPGSSRMGTGSIADTLPAARRLYIRYKALPYASAEGGGSAAITEDRGLYFINTDRKIPGKPVQIWTQGESESNSHWLPTIDKPNERFTVQIELTVPDTVQTLANGAMIASRKEGGGLRTDIWQMDKPVQTYAIMFAIGRFTIVKDSWGEKEVNYYVEDAYAANARLIFRHTPEMMSCFSALTGVPYPWNKYDQIVVRDYVSGAMENTTASLFGEFVYKDRRAINDYNNDDVVSHELFHQWFGDYVTAESWSNLTLNESFADYGEFLWRRYKYGQASADEHAYDNLNKYLGYASRSDAPLVRYYYRDREDMFDPVSYEKGGLILRYMHGLMGDLLFSKAMHIYLTRHALQPAEAADWRLAVEEATGTDWHWFFNEWYFHGGHPLLDVHYNYDDAAGRLRVTVRQVNSPDTSFLYQLPLKTALYAGGAKQVYDWMIRKRVETFTFPYVNGQRPLIVPDEGHWLPGVIREDKTPADWRRQIQVTGDYNNKRTALAGAFKTDGDTASLSAFEYALKDSLHGVRIQALKLLLASTRQAWKDRLTSQVAWMATQDGSDLVRGAAFNVLGTWKVSQSRNDMAAAVWDSSYVVAGAALKALANIDKAEAYKQAERLLGSDPHAHLEEAVWDVIAAEGAAADIRIFQEMTDKVYGTRRVAMAVFLADYMGQVKDSVSFDKGLDILDRMYRNEQIGSYRQAIFSYALTLGDVLKKEKREARSATLRDEISRRQEHARSTLEAWLPLMRERDRYEKDLKEAF